MKPDTHCSPPASRFAPVIDRNRRDGKGAVRQRPSSFASWYVRAEQTITLARRLAPSSLATVQKIR